MVGIDKKPSFLLKNIYTYNLQHLAALKTLNTCGGVTLALIFSKKIILHCSPFLCSLSKECFILNENQLCAIQNGCQYHCLLTEERRRLFLVPLVIQSCSCLVQACSSLLWLVRGCSILYKERHHRLFRPSNQL